MPVYVITNILNGKRYVGKTTGTIHERWQRHLGSATRREDQCPYLHRAIRKYGVDSFAVCTLTSDTTEPELTKSEVLLIAQMNTLAPSGYNLTLGGEGRSGWKPTEENRRNMRAAAMGNKRNLGHRLSEETKHKISAAHVGMTASVEARRKMSKAAKARFQSPEQLLLASKAGKMGAAKRWGLEY